MWPFSEGGKKPESPERADPKPNKSLARSVDLNKDAVVQDACPVDHETRSIWLRENGSNGGNPGQNATSSSAFAFLSSDESQTRASSSKQIMQSTKASGLSTNRVVSSIPRLGNADIEEASNGNHSSAGVSGPTSSKNWVYPSPAQFFAAMERKNHNPQAQDMDVVVPIHNAVNERAWQQILEWERAADNGSWSACGGPQLVSFKGRPKDVTWKAWAFGLLGYQKPFDRHDWEIDRCGRRLTYVIDFYTGRTKETDARTSLSFYLDIRPSPASWEGIRMRAARFFTRPRVPQQATSAQAK